MKRLVVLDSEAVYTLMTPAHPKHRKVVAHLGVVAQRKRKAQEIEVVVPTSVRVEACWDRRESGAAFINRMRIADAPLISAAADHAAAIRASLDVSVADAHIGATIRHADGAVTVITSDPNDIEAAASPSRPTIISI